jgi:dsRNA-specific ribonuclease
VIDQRHFASAWGPNKKEAEQKAAYNALVEMGVLRQADHREEST